MFSLGLHTLVLDKRLPPLFHCAVATNAIDNKYRRLVQSRVEQLRQHPILSLGQPVDHDVKTFVLTGQIIGERNGMRFPHKIGLLAGLGKNLFGKAANLGIRLDYRQPGRSLGQPQIERRDAPRRAYLENVVGAEEVGQPKEETPPALGNETPLPFLPPLKVIDHTATSDCLDIVVGIIAGLLADYLRDKTEGKRRMNAEAPCLTHAAHGRGIFFPELLLHLPCRLRFMSFAAAVYAASKPQYLSRQRLPESGTATHRQWPRSCEPTAGRTGISPHVRRPAD